MATSHLFVYGTLLSGESRNFFLSSCKLIDLAILHNHAIYYLNRDSIDDYPGITPSEDNFVIGEVYEIEENKLSLLDDIEGYDGTNNSLFIREKVKVTRFSNANEIECYTYIYNNSLEKAVLIEHGDYRRYKLEKKGDNIIYLAYGSNMCAQRLSERKVTPISKQVAILPGFKLAFNKKGNDNTGKANVTYTGNDKCFCIAYELTLDQLKELDKYEGVSSHYFRISTLYETLDKKLSIGEMYIANPNKVVNDLAPSKEYLSYIIKGYEENNLPLDKEIVKYKDL